MRKPKTKRQDDTGAFDWIQDVSPKTWMVLLVLAVVGAYGSALDAPFVFDDNIRIAQDPGLDRLWPIHGHPNRPVLTFSLALNKRLAGGEPAGFRAVNIAIHIASTLLLFGLLRRTLLLARFSAKMHRRATLLAFSAALLWSLHPLQTMAVTYIWQRSESMMGMFFLLTFYAFLRSETEPGRKGPAWAALASCSFLLGLGTKEVMVTAVPLLLLFDGVFLTGSFRESIRKRSRIYLVLTLGLTAFALFGKVDVRATIDDDVSQLEYLASQPSVIVHYLWKIAWPVALCIDYAWPVSEGGREILPSALLIGGLFIAALWAGMRKHPAGFLGLWFFVILSPTSGLVVLNDLAAEYRVYLSLAAVAVGLVMLADRWSRGRAGLTVSIGILVTASLFVLTKSRNQAYLDPIQLWESALEVAPHNPRAHGHVAATHLLARRFGAAERHARRAVELDPDYLIARANLGSALLQLGRKEEAVREFQRYLESGPGRRNARVHRVTGGLLLEAGKPDLAQAHFWKAMKHDPGDSQAVLGRALAKERLGKSMKAIRYARKALELAPERMEAHLILARAHARRGELEESRTALQRAGDLPEAAEVNIEITAFEHVRRGETTIAAERFEILLRMAPQQAIGLSHVASRRSAEPLWKEASEVYVRVAEAAANATNEENLVVLGNLAATYMNAGRFSEAVETVKRKETLRARRAEPSGDQASTPP